VNKSVIQLMGLIQVRTTYCTATSIPDQTETPQIHDPQSSPRPNTTVDLLCTYIVYLNAGSNFHGHSCDIAKTRFEKPFPRVGV
jgi:hypothetical protein